MFIMIRFVIMVKLAMISLVSFLMRLFNIFALSCLQSYLLLCFLIFQVVTLILVFLFMSNKEFFKYYEFQFLNLDTVIPLAIHFGKFGKSSMSFSIYCREKKVLSGSIDFGLRGFKTELSYIDFQSCVKSPYEIQSWCPTAFKHYNNYFQWLNFLAKDLDYIFVYKNPNLSLPY